MAVAQSFTPELYRLIAQIDYQCFAFNFSHFQDSLLLPPFIPDSLVYLLRPAARMAANQNQNSDRLEKDWTGCLGTDFQAVWKSNVRKSNVRSRWRRKIRLSANQNELKSDRNSSRLERIRRERNFRLRSGIRLSAKQNDSNQIGILVGWNEISGCLEIECPVRKSGCVEIDSRLSANKRWGKGNQTVCKSKRLKSDRNSGSLGRISDCLEMNADCLEMNGNEMNKVRIADCLESNADGREKSEEVPRFAKNPVKGLDHGLLSRYPMPSILK